MTDTTGVRCAERLELTALSSLPVVNEGDDIVALIVRALAQHGLTLSDCDVLTVASKVVSRAEGCFVDLGSLRPSPTAYALARKTGLDSRLVELVLRESTDVSRTAQGVLITRNRHGIVCANAGVDLSNAKPVAAADGTGPWALTLPASPDVSAKKLRAALQERTGASIGVIVTDSVGRPFRLGSVGVAVGLAGLPALWDQRGQTDLFGMTLEHTMTALADQLATAADLVAGQAAEGRGVVHVRGLQFSVGEHAAKELVRPRELDLYGEPK